MKKEEDVLSGQHFRCVDGSVVFGNKREREGEGEREREMNEEKQL